MKENVAAFRNSELFSKEEIIDSFKLTIEYIESDEESGFTMASKEKKLELCNKFLKAVEKSKLPKLTELWWFYQYEFTASGIDLNLCTASDIEVDKESNTISCMTSTVEHTLMSIKCDYVTVEEFAEIQGVTPVAVRQWIRRGKLRTAKKVGRDWLIPSFEDKPSRGYEPVQYLIEDTESLNIEEYPIISVCDSIFICQEENKTRFICIFENFKTNFREKMTLNRQEVEELELALISSGKIKLGSMVQFIPAVEKDY